MPIYFITQQYPLPTSHRAGYVNRDIRQIGKDYTSLRKVKQALYNYLDSNRIPKTFLRVDKGIAHNPIIFADTGIDGGKVRYKKSDNIHWTSSKPIDSLIPHSKH